MNLLGISWGMGARDVGMKAAVTSAQSSIETLNDTMEQQSKIAQKSKAPGLWSRLADGIKQFNIASIASDVRSLTGDTGNLTNSLEAMAVANVKAAKPFVASLNLTGAAARKMTGRISSMAISLNVGAEAVAETFKTMAQATGPAKEALDALGWSERDWVKITETTGIKAQDLTDAMGGLGAWWQASPADEVKYIARITDLGRKAGVGVEPMKKLKENLEGLAKTFEKVPPGMRRSGDEMMKLSESAVRLGGVFREMGSSEEEAVQMGQATTQMFADQAVAVEQAMKYGIGSLDDSPLFKWLTSVGVGMDEAVNIIDTGSRDAVKGTQLLQGVFEQFGKGGAQQQAMLAQLSGALGESAAGLGYLAQRGDLGAKSLERMSKITSDGKFSLKDYADQAFSTGRSLQESLDLMKEGFETRFRSIARKDVVRFVGDMGKAYKDIGDKTRELAGDETWGPLVKRLSAMNQLGLKGLFMNMGGKSNKGMAQFAVVSEAVGSALSGVATSAGPVVSLLGQLTLVLGPLGKLFGGALGKFGLWGIAIGGVAVGLKLLSKSGASVSKMFAGLLGWLGGLTEKIRGFLAGIDWKGVGKTIGGFVWDALTFVPKAIWSWVTGKEAEDEVGKAGTKLVENLIGAIGEAVKGLGSALWAMGGEIVEGISEWWDSWTWDDVKQGFEDMGDNIKGWWADLQKDPDLQEFALDTSHWVQTIGWDIQDAWYNFWNNFDVGQANIIEALNAPDVGEAAGSAIAQGISDGIDRATVVADAIERGTEKNMDAALQAVRDFDPAKVDTAWATTTAHFMNRATQMGIGITKTTVGAITGGLTTAIGDVDGGIVHFFARMGESAVQGVVQFTATLHKKIMDLAVGFGDLLWQLTHPEEAEQRWKKMQAKEAEQYYKNLEARVEAQKKYLREKHANLKQHMDKWANVQRDALLRGGIGDVGVDEKGKPKSKKKIASEQKFLAEGGSWQKTVQAVASRANAVAAAEAGLEKLRKSGAAEADVAGAESALKQAQSSLDLAMKAGSKKARKAGIGAEGIVGVKEAMDLVVRQEKERGRLASEIAAGYSDLEQLRLKAETFGQQAAAQVQEAFGTMEGSALEAGIGVGTKFSEGLADSYTIDSMVSSADAAAKTAADRLTAHSAIPMGPLANVGAGGTSDPAFIAGRNLMESFAAGIDSTAELVQGSIENLLSESVLGTIDAYQIEMQKSLARKGLLSQVAASLMKEFGAAVESTITVEGKAENVKAQMKAMLDIPGMAGVTMAIINESAKQRQILDKIRANTETMASAVGTSKGKPAFVTLAS